MPVTTKVTGVAELIKQLKARQLRYAAEGQAKAQGSTAKGGSVVVGYTQAYALFVHENLEVFHAVGQAKYLTAALSAVRNDLRKIVTDVVRKGRPLLQGLLLAGLRLQRESQLLVPVDTGALKASAFTKLE